MKRLKKTRLSMLFVAALCQIGWADEVDTASDTLGTAAEPLKEELGVYEAKPDCPKMHRRYFLREGVRVQLGLDSTLRFDNLRHEGPSQLTFLLNSPDNIIANNGVYNRFSLTLVERALKARVIFYDRAFIQTNAAYGVAATSTHIRQNINWDPSNSPHKDGYFYNNAYSYDLNASVGGLIRWNSWASNSLEFGWGYQRLYLSDLSDVRYSAPFIRLGSCYEFSERWTIDFSGAYHFLGSRKEEVTPVLLNLYGLNTSDMVLDTTHINSGNLRGASVNLSVGYAFTKHWGVSLGYEFKGFKTSRKCLGSTWDQTTITGTWSEQTRWFSNRLHMGVDYSF